MISASHSHSPIFEILSFESSFLATVFFLSLPETSAAAAAATSLQSCATLGNPIDGSPPGSAVLGFLQAKTLEWVAISFSNAWKWKVKVKSLSRVRLLDTPWTAGLQPTRLLRPWDFPGKSTGVGCHCLLLWNPLAVHNSSFQFVAYSWPSFSPCPDQRVF